MDQVIILYCLFEVGVGVLFMSPSCGPLGANSRALPYDQKADERKKQEGTLMFLALCALVQHLLMKMYLLENPAFSELFTATESPMSALRVFPHFVRRLN